MFFFVVAITATRPRLALFLQFDPQCVLVGNRNDRQTSNIVFLRAHGPHSAEHSDLTLQILNLIVQVFPQLCFQLVLRL